MSDAAHDDPDGPPPGPFPETLAALAQVAVHAMFLRDLAAENWGPATEEVMGMAMRNLSQALERLELSDPAMHAGLSSHVQSGIQGLREDLGFSG